MIKLTILVLLLATISKTSNISSTSNCFGNCLTCPVYQMSKCNLIPDLPTCQDGYIFDNTLGTCSLKSSLSSSYVSSEFISQTRSKTQINMGNTLWRKGKVIQCSYIDVIGFQQYFSAIGLYKQVSSISKDFAVSSNHQFYIFSFNLLRDSWMPFNDFLTIDIGANNKVINSYQISFDNKNASTLSSFIVCSQISVQAEKYTFKIDTTTFTTESIKITFTSFLMKSVWGISNIKFIPGCQKFTVYDKSSGNCGLCLDGFYPVYTKVNTGTNVNQYLGQCMKCNSTCTKCTNQTQCIACVNGYILGPQKTCISNQLYQIIPITSFDKPNITTCKNFNQQFYSIFAGGLQSSNYINAKEVAYGKSSLTFQLVYNAKFVLKGGKIDIQVNGVKVDSISNYNLTESKGFAVCSTDNLDRYSIQKFVISLKKVQSAVNITFLTNTCIGCKFGISNINFVYVDRSVLSAQQLASLDSQQIQHAQAQKTAQKQLVYIPMVNVATINPVNTASDPILAPIANLMATLSSPIDSPLSLITNPVSSPIISASPNSLPNPISNQTPNITSAPTLSLPDPIINLTVSSFEKLSSNLTNSSIPNIQSPISNINNTLTILPISQNPILISNNTLPSNNTSSVSNSKIFDSILANLSNLTSNTFVPTILTTQDASLLSLNSTANFTNMSNSTSMSNWANMHNTNSTSNSISMLNTLVNNSSLILNSSLSFVPIQNNIQTEAPVNIPLISVVKPVSNNTDLIEPVYTSNNINKNTNNSLRSPSNAIQVPSDQVSSIKQPIIAPNNVTSSNKASNQNLPVTLSNKTSPIVVDSLKNVDNLLVPENIKQSSQASEVNTTIIASKYNKESAAVPSTSQVNKNKVSLANQLNATTVQSVTQANQTRVVLPASLANSTIVVPSKSQVNTTKLLPSTSQVNSTTFFSSQINLKTSQAALNSSVIASKVKQESNPINNTTLIQTVAVPQKNQSVLQKPTPAIKKNTQSMTTFQNQQSNNTQSMTNFSNQSSNSSSLRDDSKPNTFNSETIEQLSISKQNSNGMFIKLNQPLLTTINQTILMKISDIDGKNPSFLLPESLNSSHIPTKHMTNTYFYHINQTNINKNVQLFSVNTDVNLKTFNASPEVKMVALFQVIRADQISQDSQSLLNGFQHIFTAVAWIAIILLFIFSLAGKLYLIEDCLLSFQKLFLGIYVFTSYLPASILNTLSGLRRLQNLDYFALSHMSALQTGFVGDLTQDSPLRFTLFHKDINFTRNVIPILFFLTIIVVWFVIVYILKRKFAPVSQTVAFENDLMIQSEIPNQSQQARIFLTFARSQVFNEVITKKLNYFIQIVKVVSLPIIFLSLKQFSNFSYPAAISGQIPNMLFCLLLFILVISLTIGVVMHCANLYFELQYQTFVSLFPSLYFKKIPKNYLPSQHHRLTYPMLKFLTIFIYALLIGTFGNYPILISIIMVCINVMDMLYAWHFQIYQDELYYKFAITQAIMFSTLSLIIFVLSFISNSAQTNAYLAFGYVYMTLAIVIVINNFVRVAYLVFDHFKKIKNGSEKDFVAPPLRSERIV